jgi:signal transduction histidine kinase
MLGPAEEGTVMQAADGRIVLCNAAAERILGLTFTQLIGKRSVDADWRAVRADGSPFPGPEHPAMLALRTGQAVEGVRMGLPRSGGEVAWITIRALPLRRNDRERPWGVVTAFRADPQPGRLPSTSPDLPREVFWELDFAHGAVRAQPSLEEALGLHTPQRPELWMEELAAEDREAVERAWRAHLDGETHLIEVDCRLRTLAGGWRWVRGRYRVLERLPDGRPALVAGTLSDVTWKHTLEAQLSATERLASIGTLAAGVAHEINNPLAWISGNLGYVLEHLGEPGAELEELRQALKDAQQGVVRVSDIVRRLRSFGQPSLGPSRARVEVREEVQEALALCRHEVSHRAVLVVEVPARLPDVLLGPHELSQVLVHLLRNASEAIPEGRADQHQVTVRALRQGGEVLVEVRDTGHGIAAEVRPRIFEPFFTTRSAREGTGLGLSVCHGLISAAGGRIEVESAPGRGACFRVVLPAILGELTPRAAATEDQSFSHGEPTPRGAARSGRRPRSDRRDA